MSTTTATTRTSRQLEDAAVAVLTDTTPLTREAAETVAAACQQFQTRDPLITRILTTDPDTQTHALDRTWEVLTHIDPDGETLTTAAVLAWSITGDSLEALALLTQANAAGTHSQLADLITHAITAGLPYTTWQTMTAGTTLDTLRTGTA